MNDDITLSAGGTQGRGRFGSGWLNRGCWLVGNRSRPRPTLSSRPCWRDLRFFCRVFVVGRIGFLRFGDEVDSVGTVTAGRSGLDSSARVGMTVGAVGTGLNGHYPGMTVAAPRTIQRVENPQVRRFKVAV